ncbi:MAG: hypothetical protein PHT96_09560 [Syntrophorhabdaceae bacterium]|nr:hypothetical protein [Syntrophorhabdaceae bacterium]MDD4196641.1 hypothetical protein [Syntrophorhabdaceae bacterium]HOC45545.1 hypothetical protein [Syntrophorhabdaceae bacterium]
MEEITKIALEEYEKKSDGSWVCVKNSDITTSKGNILRIAPGTIFRPGGKFLGIDIAEALNKKAAV